MIPLEITLRNFLTYDDNDGAGYTFDFRDHDLWSISGDNGAGKSSLFDVITFTLFGQHRGGAQGGDELLNKQASSFACAFTFAHKDVTYKVTRTLNKRIKRNGEAAYQPAAQIDWYDENADAWRQVPDTETVRALEEFIRNLLGFDYETFISSVLLLQGESDKLIRAAPAKRFQHLSGILDLSRYRRLEDRAKAKAAEARAKRDVLSQRLVAQGIPSDVEVAAAEATAQAAHQRHTIANKAAEAARAFTKRVEAYRALVARREAVSEQVGRLTEAQQNADAIRDDARALRELSDALPRLRDAHTCLSDAERAEVRSVAAKEEAAAVNVEGAAATVKDAVTAHMAAEAACTALAQRRRTLTKEARDLQPERKVAAQLEGLDTTIEESNASIAELDARLEELPAVTALAGRLEAITHGQQLMHTYHRARTDLAAIADGQNAAKIADAETEAERTRVAAEKELEELRSTLEQSQLAAGTLQGEVDSAKRTLDEREQAGAEGTCSHCGQKVSAEHIKQEITACRSTVARLQTKRAEAERCARESAAAVKAAEQALRESRDAEQRARDRAQEFRRISAAIEGLDADEAMAALPADCRTALHGPLPKLRGAITGFVQETKERAQTVRRQQRLAADVGERQRVVRIRDDAASKRDQVLEQITRERVAVVIRRAGELEDECTAVDEQEPQLEEARADAAARRADAQAELDSRRERKAELEEVARSEAQTALAKREAAASIITYIGPEHLPPSAEKVAAVEERVTMLAGAEERLRLLEEAQRDLAGARGQLQEVDAGLSAVPASDRIPVADARSAQMEAETAAKNADAARNQAVEQAATLNSKRRDLLETREQAERFSETHHVYNRLAHLLGRSGIQLAVMKHDLAQIERLANPLLARISGGSLQLRIDCLPGRNQAEEINFRCVDSNSADEPLDVAFLSGGQKFRVAVALAAGIGQYAGLGGSLPSVIIDEGFGSLDESGRTEMLEAIREMAAHFERIIVVSHTDSFHDPALFPARYELRKEGRKIRVLKSV